MGWLAARSLLSPLVPLTFLPAYRYYVEYRQTMSFAPAAANFENGAVFHYVDDLGTNNLEQETNLLDMMVGLALLHAFS